MDQTSGPERTSGSPEDTPSTLDDLGTLARSLIADGRRHILGVTGPPGAGKSTVCTALLAALGPEAAVVQMDGFHLADDELRRIGRRDRKGAPDTFDVDGYAAILSRLRDRRDPVVYTPRFDRGLEEPIAGSTAVPVSVPLVITEGNYLLHDNDGWSRIGGLLDSCWYLDVPAQLREDRLVKRRVGHGEDSARAQSWVRTVDHTNAELISQTRCRADRTIQLMTDQIGTAS